MPYVNYIKAGVLIILVCGIFFTGWHIRDRDFTDYKIQQQIEVTKQQEKIESIQRQNDLVNKGIQDEYDAKLALIRKYYSNGVQQPSPSTAGSVSNTASLSDAITSYNKLASQCAETTLMLVELQKWIAEQVGIFNTK
jgi:hypothetical protein